MQNIIRTNKESEQSDGCDYINVQVNSELVTIRRNNSEIAAFLWSMKEELMSLNIEIPDQVLNLDNEQMEDVLSHIVSNPKLVNTDKVKRFFITCKNEPVKIRVSAEIVKTCRPMKAKVSIENPEMIPYIQTFGYSEVVPIADGATKAVFKAKNQRKEFVAVKVTRLEEKHNEQEDIMKEVEQKMSRALFGGFLKVNRLIKDEDNRLMIIQEQLANKTLRDIILEKRVKNQNFTLAEMKKIIKDLVQSLYYMHVQNQVAHRDIKPQNIFYMEHRYSFGDYGEAEKKRTNILSPQIKIKMTELKGTPMYMEPRLLKLYNKIQMPEGNKHTVSMTHTFSSGDSFFEYDPFKADVYSLGFVFLELCLHNLGYVLDEQMQTIFYERDFEFIRKTVASIDLRSKDEKYIFFGQCMYEMPNLLEMMTNEDENLRINTFNLALLSTPKQTLLSHVLTPFTDIFLPNKTIDDEEKGTYIVEYNYKGMVYRGEFANDKRQGYGIIYSRIPTNFSKIKEVLTEESQEDSGYKSNMDGSSDLSIIYEGYWKNDLPHGQGKLMLNDSENRYEGEFIRGMFSGEGGLYYGKTTIIKCPWRGNYNQYILKPLSEFPDRKFRFQIVCPISLTICGFQQTSSEPAPQKPKKQFVIEIEQHHSSLIKIVLGELIQAHKKFEISKIEISRNLLHRYSEFILSNENQCLYFVFALSVSLEGWLLTKIVELMRVESMKVLNLNKSEMSSEPFYMMANKIRCFNITDLDLNNCSFISSNGLNKFFSTSIVNSITKLNISNTLISNDTLRIFAESKFLVRLRELVMRSCLGLTDYALKIFIQSSNVKELELFDIGNTALAEGFTQGFLWQNQFKKLRRLKIDHMKFQEQDIIHLVELPVFQGLTEFHADPIWIKYISKFQNLRVLTLKGHTKIKIAQLFSFLKNWQHNKLDVSAINITHEKQGYEFYQKHLSKLNSNSQIKSLIVNCDQSDLFYTFELMKNQLRTVEVNMNNNIEIFKQEFENIKARKWNINEIVFKYNKNVLEYITSILDLDFEAVKVDSIKIIGCYTEKKNKIFEQMEDNKIRFLEFNEMLKKITSVIRVKTVKIEEILYTDGVIAEMVKPQLSESVETLVINNHRYTVKNLYTMNNDYIQMCNISQTQTLDETFHALSVSECLSQLQGLNLFKRQNVGEKGLAHIINSKYCENIKQLNLSYTDISSDIFNLLINSQRLHLNKLALNGIKKFHIQDLQRYVACDNAKQIKKMSLKDTNLNQLDVFFLQLTLSELEEIDIKFDPALECSNVNYENLEIKFENLKKIYLDFYNCQMKKVAQKIFSILSSSLLSRLKLNLRCCKQKDLQYYQISELIFLRYLKTRKFKQFRIYFDSTTIFETSFIIYFQTINTFQLDLSFQRVLDNQFVQKLSFIFPNFNIKVVTLNFSESPVDNTSTEHIYSLIKGLKRVEEVTLNFSKLSYIINWARIVEAFPALQDIKKFNVNFADCKIGDEFEVVINWLEEVTRKRKIELTLDLAHCERIKSDKVFGKLALLLSKEGRFNSKIRLDVTRFSNIPLDFKYKLIELNHLSEKYELLVDSSDK